MSMKIRSATILAACLAPLPLWAQGLEVQQVTDGLWAIVGDMSQRSPENLGNNATFGLVVTPAGAVLMDPGGSWQGAEALHAAIRTITDAPVEFVVNTGGQDHRWLGNGYWQAQGAVIIASADAVADQQARGSLQMSALSQLLGAGLEGTEPSTADIVFEGQYAFDLGGVSFEILHPGAAHTPGDSFVWVAQMGTVFTGDIVYVERILGVGDQSSITDWPASFEAIAALSPMHVVPGHGHATTLEHATHDTYDYLMNLRTQIGALLDEGGDIMAAPHVDQSAFTYLDQFESLAGRNAQTAFQQMEWE
jgi:glyoxylase-like metal-dependent hydrolase (beta-lactamase superfamily II)